MAQYLDMKTGEVKDDGQDPPKGITKQQRHDWKLRHGGGKRETFLLHHVDVDALGAAELLFSSSRSHTVRSAIRLFSYLQFTAPGSLHKLLTKAEQYHDKT